MVGGRSGVAVNFHCGFQSNADATRIARSSPAAK
jgi:hypothetical protein